MNRYSYDHQKNAFLEESSGKRPSGGMRPSGGAPRPAAGGRGPRKPVKKRGLHIAVVIAIDVLLAALLLLIFYVTNYIIKTEVQPTALPTPTSGAVSTESMESSASATSTDSGTTTAAIDPSDWRTKFADKFTDGEPILTENSYISANINITVEIQTIDNVRYYVAEIYVAGLDYFKTAFAKNASVMGDREMTDVVAQENNALIAITGDHSVDSQGTVIRNGQMYRKPKSSFDVLIMGYDGSMETLSPNDFDVDKIESEGAYQVWSFGPMLLQNGQTMTEFNMPDSIGGSNPRASIGYYEPGHYCFVVVGGRQESYSEGCTLVELSQFMYDRGCTVAYNLDGGRSAEMIFMGKMLNEQAGGRRSTPDIIYIGENEG